VVPELLGVFHTQVGIDNAAKAKVRQPPAFHEILFWQRNHVERSFASRCSTNGANWRPL
jgi:hypothetical protein